MSMPYRLVAILTLLVVSFGCQSPGNGGDDGLALHVAEGGTSSIIFVADAPGTYVIFCTVDNHREAGMVGVIKVV